MDPVALMVPQALNRLVAFGEGMGAFVRIPRRLASGDVPIPLTFAGHVLEELSRAAGVESFGLRAGAASRFEDAPLSVVVRGAPTLGSALVAAAAASSRYCGGQQVWVTRREGQVRVQRRFPNAMREGRRQANDFALLMLIDLVRRAAGPCWRPGALYLEGPSPAHAEELAALSAGSTHFGAPADCVVFPHDVLALRLPPTTGPTAPSPAPLGNLDFVASIRETIRCLLELGQLGIPNVAEAVGTSVRSLQRRLAEEGVRFTRLVDDARFEAASRLLSDPRTRITDVSVELGYTDASNFTRAFHRWAGVSPQDFRRSAGLAPAVGVE